MCFFNDLWLVRARERETPLTPIITNTSMPTGITWTKWEGWSWSCFVSLPAEIQVTLQWYWLVGREGGRRVLNRVFVKCWASFSFLERHELFLAVPIIEARWERVCEWYAKGRATEQIYCTSWAWHYGSSWWTASSWRTLREETHTQTSA